MPPFSLLIKPASSDCNLRCRYCFYLDARARRSDAPSRRMNEVTLERMIAGYMATPQPVYAFGWQGGEPTLMGLDFFRQVVARQAAHARPGTKVANSLQTNGTLLNDEFAAFLAEYRFLVGVSLDGPAAMHDAERQTAGGTGSHALALAGIECLRRNQVEFNVLTLVNRANVSRPVEVYDYLVAQGFYFHQYIECVEFAPDGTLQPFAITGPAWGDFLCQLFDRWYAQDTDRVSVRLFDTVLEKMVYGTASSCIAGKNCCQYFVVESSGDVYPCDFHVKPRWKLGNISTTTWAALQQSPAYVAFGKRKWQRDAHCVSCVFLPFCQGDCPKNRGGLQKPDPSRRSHLCEGWKQFYRHTLPRFEKLADVIRSERKFPRA